VVWTLTVPDDRISFDARNGTASVHMGDLAMMDHHSIPNVLQGDAVTPVPGTVSFDLRWKASPKQFAVTDSQARGYTGEFAEAGALLSWSAKQDGFQFTSDSLESSSSLFAMMGHERNGVYAAPAASAGVRITDAGFDPPDTRVATGGTVTWTNDGVAVHSVRAASGNGLSINSGGLARGQSYQFTFQQPGTYFYTSEVDCLNGNRTPGFGCAYATVNVS
jgi:plastocyanin